MQKKGKENQGSQSSHTFHPNQFELSTCHADDEFYSAALSRRKYKKYQRRIRGRKIRRYLVSTLVKV